MFEFLIAGCIVFQNEVYYTDDATPTSQCQVIDEHPTNSSSIQLEDRTKVMQVPIHQLNPTTMTDPRYAEIVFTFETVYDANNCLESMVYLLEGEFAGNDVKCAKMVHEVFGNEFGSNPAVTENVIRMWAHRLRSYLKRPVVIPGGVQRRLESLTGLTGE